MFSGDGFSSAGPAMPGTAPASPDGLASMTSDGSSSLVSATIIPSCGSGARHFFEKSPIKIQQDCNALRGRAFGAAQFGAGNAALFCQGVDVPAVVALVGEE